jgi:hypothetical protein
MFSKSALVLAAFVTIAVSATSANARIVAAAPVANTIATTPIATTSTAPASAAAAGPLGPSGTIVYQPNGGGNGCTLNGLHYATYQTVDIDVYQHGKHTTVTIVCTGGGWRVA